MPPKKKKGRKKKKKVPAFYTDIDDLLPFGVVRANEIITTALGVEATVLGVKYKVKGDKDSGRLWVQYRCGYQCPLETQLEEHKRAPEGANVWKPVAELQEKLRTEGEVRYKVNELNRRHQEMLDAKNKKSKPRKKKPKPPADATPAGAPKPVLPPAAAAAASVPAGAARKSRSSAIAPPPAKVAAARSKK